MAEKAKKFEIGRGEISGWISATLGLLALCGVLCFHFPKFLTSEQFRASYSPDFARSLMLIGLIIAYLTGMVSYILNRSKRLSLFGLSTSLIASVLGGSRVIVQPFESTPYSFGLDWFAISFLFSMLILIPIERAFALHPEQHILRPQWKTDLVYFFVSHLLIQFIFIFVNGFSQTLFSWAIIPSLQNAVLSLPVWAQFIAAVFFADLSQYTTHRMCHLVPFLWRFHSIHHNSESMDWLSGSRTHLVEVFFTRALVMLPLYWVGFSESALNAYIVLVGIQAVMIHANVGINFGPLRFLLATPQFHHWHHSKDPQYMDANYSVHLPIIDMMFGTFRCPHKQWPAEYGIVSDPPPPTFFQQLLHPFRVR